MRRVVSNIKIALTSLNAQCHFAIFDIPYSSAEKKALDNLHISSTNAYDNFGNLDILIHEISTFIQAVGQNTSETSGLIANLIENLVKNIISAFERETAWVTVRSSIATSFWGVPRWHYSDGYYYSPYIGEQYKIAVTLKGPSTLFYPLPDELREQFNSLRFNPENREIIAKILDKSNAISIGQKGSVFIVGTNYAAVHSEPPIHEERLFLSIVPGNKIEINELYKNWYPKGIPRVFQYEMSLKDGS